MSFEMNVYYNPEKHDLEPVAEVDFGRSYEFDITMLWRHKPTGDLYTAQDSGCSCPSPFENYTSLADLTKVNEQVYGELMNLRSYDGRHDDDFTRKVDEAWREHRRAEASK